MNTQTRSPQDAAKFTIMRLRQESPRIPRAGKVHNTHTLAFGSRINHHFRTEFMAMRLRMQWRCGKNCGSVFMQRVEHFQRLNLQPQAERAGELIDFTAIIA